MNNDRRKAIRKLMDQAAEILAAASEIAGKLEDLKGEVEAIKDEEEEYKDNMPENLNGSEKYETADAAVSALENAAEGLDTLITALQSADDEIIAKLDEATA